MSKRKPDKVVVHRIELQQKERDLLETAIIAEAVKDVAPAIIGIAGTATGGYMLLAYLHMLAPTSFPAPPLLPDAVENASTNGFIQYAQNYVERRTDDGIIGYINPFTVIPDIIGSAIDAVTNGNGQTQNGESANVDVPTYPEGGTAGRDPSTYASSPRSR